MQTERYQQYNDASMIPESSKADASIALAVVWIC